MAVSSPPPPPPAPVNMTPCRDRLQPFQSRCSQPLLPTTYSVTATDPPTYRTDRQPGTATLTQPRNHLPPSPAHTTPDPVALVSAHYQVGDGDRIHPPLHPTKRAGQLAGRQHWHRVVERQPPPVCIDDLARDVAGRVRRQEGCHLADL